MNYTLFCLRIDYYKFKLKKILAELKSYFFEIIISLSLSFLVLFRKEVSDEKNIKIYFIPS